jgi:hypothetical protein
VCYNKYIKEKEKMKMIVNKERLERLNDGAVVCCEDCPLESELECNKYCQKVDEDTHLKSCAEALLDWLQEFDIAEALEEGAHIVNGVAIFPHEEIPSQLNYGTPCEEVNRRGKADWWCEAAYCDYADCCPYL